MNQRRMRRGIGDVQSDYGSNYSNAADQSNGGDSFDPALERLQTLTMQTQLNQFPSALPRLAVDGNWGANTQARLEEFQQQHGLAVTGLDDDATYTVLAAGYTPTGGAQNNNNQPPRQNSQNPFATLTTNEKYVLGGAAALIVLALVMEGHS